jgi:hypothetical protein
MGMPTLRLVDERALEVQETKQRDAMAHHYSGPDFVFPPRAPEPTSRARLDHDEEALRRNHYRHGPGGPGGGGSVCGCDYEIVADNLFNADHRRVSDRIPSYALYIDPPLGRCGMTEAEIRTSGRHVLAAKYPVSKVSRAYEKGDTQGFIKVSSRSASMRKPNRLSSGDS